MTSKVQQDFVVGALIGGVVGATVALMFAPVPGSKLRHQISDGIGFPTEPKHKKRPNGVKKAKAAVKSGVKKAKSVAKKATTVVKKAAEKSVRKPRAKKASKAAHAAHHGHTAEHKAH